MDELIFDYLLGSPTAGPGLIRRVDDCISSMEGGWKPVFRTGSYIGTGDVSHDSKDEDGRVDEVFRLGVSLTAWTVDRSPVEGSVPRLAEYLVKNKLSDIDWTRSRLKQVRGTIRDLSRQQLPNLDKAKSLISILKGFLGDCDHDFTEVPSDVGGVYVYRCDCGASYKMYDGHEEWFAV